MAKTIVNLIPRKGGASRRPIFRRAIAALVVGGIVATAFTANTAQSAFAVELPTWNDVQQAKANEAATAAKVTEIEGLVKTLQDEVAATQAEALRTATVLDDAEQKFNDADHRYNSLVEQAAASEEKATTASTQASSIAAQMYRSSGSDQTLELFLDQNAASADGLLSKLSMMTQATDRNNTVYEDAKVASNNAKSLGDQAEEAKTERERLRAEADAAFKAAAEASQKAQEQLAAQQVQQETLNAQLAALKDTTQATVAGYQERLAQEAAARKAAEEAAAQARAAAAAAAAAQRPAGGGGGGGGGGGTLPPVSGDWARPSNGYWSSGYGGRGQVCSSYGCTGGAFHTGTDLAAPEGSPIFAASSGTVTFSGPRPSYGNMIEIDHGGGIKTRYGHIMNGGLYVSVGQRVGVGEVIAGTGQTGMATGPHVHFEVYVNGSTTDPEPFMWARGISLR